MVDKTTPKSTEKNANDSLEELFLRNAADDGTLRKKADEEDLKLNDSQEEIFLQNIQRGSEQKVETDRSGVGNVEDTDSPEISVDQSSVIKTSQSQTRYESSNDASSTGSVNGETLSQSSKIGSDDLVDHNQITNKTFIDQNNTISGDVEKQFSFEKEQTVQSAEKNDFVSVDEPAETRSTIDENYNTAPEAGNDVAIETTDNPVIEGKLQATDADAGEALSYKVVEGMELPDGFSLSDDGEWKFDAKVKAYEHLGTGDSVVVTVPIVVSDERGATDSVQIKVTVNGTNNDPVAGASISSDVGENALEISGQLSATDVDEGTVLSWSIAEGYATPDGFTINTDGSYSFDPANESYDYLNVGDSLTITIPVIVTDEEDALDESQIQITVSGTNDVPVAGTEVIENISEASSIISGQLASTDIDQGAVSSWNVSEGVSVPAGFILNSDGSYSFDPTDNAYNHLNVGDSEVITIPVTVMDEHGATDTSQIQVVVSGTNDAPVAGAAISATVDEESAAITGQLTSSDLDDGATTSWGMSEGVSAPDGFVINTDGNYSFNPTNSAYQHLNIGDSEVITIPVTVTDEHGVTDTSQIQITVTGSNDAPVAGAAISTNVDEGSSSISGQLSSIDIDENAISNWNVTEGVSSPAGFNLDASGSYSFDPGDSSYAHLNIGDSQVITIPVTVTDEHGATDSSQIQITVTGTNDAPVAGAAISSTVDEGSATITGQLTSSDLDDGATTSWSMSEGVSAPDGFVISTDGNYSFNPTNSAYQHLNIGDSEVITVPVTVTDEHGATDTSQIQVTVTGVNDAPIAGATISAQVDEGASVISGQLSSTDIDENAISNWNVTEGINSPAGFNFDANGSYSFDPGDSSYAHLNIGDSQVITIPVTVTDEHGATDSSQIQITVLGTNDAPIAGTSVNSTVEEGATAISGQLVSTDLDYAASSSWTVSEGVATPEGFVLNDDGSYNFDPDNDSYNHLNIGDSQVITIPVTVTDEHGESDTSQIQITILGTNDAPVAGTTIRATVDEGSSSISGQLTSSDLDNGATTSWSVSEGVSSPDGFIISTDGNYSFNPADSAFQHLNIGDSEVITVPVTVIDEHGATDTSQIQITVSGTNDAPVAGAAINAQVNEGASVISGQLSSTDIDNNATSNWDVSEGVSSPAGFNLDANGSYSFDPSDSSYANLNVGDNQIITIPVTVTDENGATDTSQIQITVSGTNDAPVAGASINAQVDEGDSIIHGQLDSTDVDDNANTVWSVSEGTSAPDGFVINADGSYSFDPSDNAYEQLAEGQNALLTISVTVTDEHGATDTSQIQITISGTNDAPVAGASVIANTDEGAALMSGQLTVIDFDEGASTAFSITDDRNIPDGFSLSSDGSYSFDPTDNAYNHLNVGDSEILTIPITVTDEFGATDTTQIEITVSGTNDAPTAIVFSGGEVDENASAKIVVAEMKTKDADDGESFTYTIADDPSGFFEISGDQVIVNEGADIDFESAQSHNISVEVTDSSGNSYIEDVTINVNDINENMAPDAVSDVSNSFAPENATLTADITFDNDVPTASYGSVRTNEEGQVGDAANFSYGKVEVSDLALNSDAGAQTTVSMWIQANPEGGWEMLAASDRYDMVMLNGDIGFNTSNYDMFGTDASELADGEWHHVVGVFTNGDVSRNMIYIDGVEQEMSQIYGAPNNSVANIDSSDGSLYFGSWGANNAYHFSGSMDEVKVFDGVLSNDEISQLHEMEGNHSSWSGGYLSTQEDTVLTINSSELLANDTDPDGDSLTIISVETGKHGTVELDAEGNVQFTPDENYNGEASFSYTISDGNGGEDATTVTLNVSSVNDAPTIDVVSKISVDEDGSQQIVYNVSDVDSSDVEFTGEATNGAVVINDNGTITFTPNEDYYGDDKIVLTATDSNGAVSTQEISVTVNPINDAPDAVDDISFDPQSATLTAEINFDNGIPAATYGYVGAKADGQVGDAANFSSAKVEVSDLALNGDAGAQTTVSMWIQANPEGGWEMLAASDRYDMVMLNGDIGFNTGRGDLFGTDASELADGEWHHVVGVFTNGDVSQNTIHIDGVEQEMSQIRGAPNNNVANIDSSDGSLYFGSWGVNSGYRFTGSMDEVKVFDGVLSNDEINQLHDIESSNAKWDTTTLSTDEDVALVIDPASLLGNDLDVDGDVLSIASVQDAQNGTVEIDSDGNIVFTPTEDYYGEARFSYTVDDGNGSTDTATAILDVVSVEDAPTQVSIKSGSIKENMEFHGTEKSDSISGTDSSDTIYGGGGDDKIAAGAGDDIIVGGTGNDKVDGGEGNDTFMLNPSEGNDYFYGGEGGGWTDVIDVSAMVAKDSENPWTIEVDGSKVEYDLAAGALDMNTDSAGVISFGDGSELSFEGVERIEW